MIIGPAPHYVISPWVQYKKLIGLKTYPAVILDVAYPIRVSEEIFRLSRKKKAVRTFESG